MTIAARQPIWTRAFSLLCTAVFLAFVQYSMLSVVIPLYVVHLGGTPLLAGLVLLTYSLPSIFLRPFIGYWADGWSLAAVLTLGLLLMGASGFWYLVPAVSVVFLASAVRGLGWAAFMTGGYTTVAHIAPDTRRGEVSGYYNTVMTSTTIFFPALGLWLLKAPLGGYGSVFVLTSICALLSASVGYAGVRPALQRRTSKRVATRQAGSVWAGLLEPVVLLATLLNLCSTLTQPAVTSFLPLYAQHRGIGDIGWFYVLSGIVGLIVRPILGRASDRGGRGVWILVGLLAQAAGFSLIVIFGTLPIILVSGILNAIGIALTSGATMALAMDVANPESRGTAMGTYSLSYQLGAGAGAVLAGEMIDLAGYRGMFTGSLALLALGVLITVTVWPRLAGYQPDLAPSAAGD